MSKSKSLEFIFSSNLLKNS